MWGGLLPRNSERNNEIKKNRKMQILDATLNIYIRFGYHGTDMDIVAEEAKLAKGLIYYYFKTKKELFSELYAWMFNESYSYSETLLRNTEGMNPVEQLMAYCFGMFIANKNNPRMMQFAIRIPFDAFAIFDPDQWKDGAQKSEMHARALSAIIKKGITQGLIPNINPSAAANSFWSVFVANLFEYSKLITGAQETAQIDEENFTDVVRFCFQGLGIQYDVWRSCLSKCYQSQKGD